jgi:hypothetical protein
MSHSVNAEGHVHSQATTPAAHASLCEGSRQLLQESHVDILQQLKNSYKQRGEERAADAQRA